MNEEQLLERLRILRKLFFSCSKSLEDHEIGMYYSKKIDEVKEVLRILHKIEGI